MRGTEAFCSPPARLLTYAKPQTSNRQSLRHVNDDGQSWQQMRRTKRVAEPTTPTTTTTMRPPMKEPMRMGLKRERVRPDDEAFVTCPTCGSDEVTSCSKLLSRGSATVVCSQCGETWTAQAEEGLTDEGVPLLEKVRKARDAVAAAAGGGGGVRGEGMSGMGMGVGVGTGTGATLGARGVRLYVSGLGPRVDSAALRQAVEVYGEVRDASVVFDKASGRSRGFGFVTVVGRSMASAVIDDLSGSSVLGQRLKVREARE